MVRSLWLELPAGAGPVVARAMEIFKARLEARCPARVTLVGPADFRVQLALAPGLGQEGFRFEDLPEGGLRIAANDERGLLYGLGKFLRSSLYSGEGLTPSPWRGTSVPEKPVRGIYFATHFHNFYHEAPLGEIETYLEDLALWGINSLIVWFDLHEYHGFHDPAAQAMVERLRAILQAACAVGMSPGTAVLANEGYADSPPQMRATWGRGETHLPAHYHVELCPNEPGAIALMLRWTEQRLEAFADLGLEYLWIWPHDQGGCCCSRCHPWGGNGFLTIAEPVARLFRQMCPQGKVVLSTWYFDQCMTGEWEGLARAFRERPDWVDYLLADAHGGTPFPAYPLEHGVPGGLPLLGFPEISMYGFCPWGGFGANPYPSIIERSWAQCRELVEGGWPYSEGIFEDLNKAVCAGLYWSPERPVQDIVREYAAYEFAPQVAEQVWRVAEIFERTLPRRREQAGGMTRFPLADPSGTDEAYALLQSAERVLSPQARESWRWRLLMLRGLLDAELVRSDFAVSETAEVALEELTRLYHAQRAAGCVAPPTRAALQAARGQ